MDWHELEHTTTLELFEYMRGKEEFEEAAICAFHNFFLRFENELTKKCRRLSLNWGFDQTTGDIISEQALQKLWEKPHLFNATKCKVDNLDKCVLLYLFRIAQNLLADRKRDINSVKAYDGDEEVVVEFPDLENSTLPAEKLKEVKAYYDLINKALERLSPKHKIIFLTYHAYEKKDMKLPRPLLEKLRDELDLTQATIRVYKKQAKETVNQILKVYGSK